MMAAGCMNWLREALPQALRGKSAGGACNVVKIRSIGSQSGALNDD
jgi:hypothetical protein